MSPKGKITVVLADDTLIAREGWKRILETSEEIKVIGEAATTHDATHIAEKLRPQVILMDLSWFGDQTAGWMAISEIKKSSPEIKVIAVTAYENLIRDARRAGADAALLKTFTRNEMINLIEDIAQQESNISKSQIIKTHNKLTNREVQVLSLLKEGYNDKEISDLLEISLPTTKNHVKNVLKKTNSKNRAELNSKADTL